MFKSSLYKNIYVNYIYLSFKISNFKDTYYIKDEDGNPLTDHNDQHNNVLFFCTVPDICEKDTSTIGYVVNRKDNSKYIACKSKINGENDCDIYETLPIPNEGSYCSVAELYKSEGDNYKLCIDENNLVTVNADNEASYFVDAMSESTFIHQNNVPKTGQYYIAVSINSGNIILNAKGNFYNKK